MPLTCPSCSSSEIETDSARGSQVCTRCGMVLEDNIIISEVSFTETAGGASNVVGQSVAADGTKPFSSMLTGVGFHGGYTRDSRQMTIENGRKAISGLANSLSLHNHHVDSAHRYFKLAVEHRFIQGRKTEFVVAACLYIVCRYEKTSHMLLDFADALQVNVFTLGSVYLKLVRKLLIRGMPIIDPSLYMLRFANKLDFGDKTHEVGRTALRLVARMKRDWLQVGRRPAGICGAGLLIAARLHGFHKTQKEIIKVVRVCESTLRKRLEEFEDTPSSGLTTHEFMKIDLETEADPPSYTQARKRARADGKKPAKGAATAAAAAAAAAARTTKDGVDPALEEEMQRMASIPAFQALNTKIIADVSTSKPAPPKAAPVAGAPVAAGQPPATAAAAAAGGAATVAVSAAPAPAPTTTVSDVVFAVPAAAAVLPKTPAWDANADDDGALSDLSDTEIDGLLLQEHEVRVKTEIWMKENKEYLERETARRKQEELDAEMGIVNPESKRRKRRNDKPVKPASSAAEAVQQMLATKKTSSKINYGVLRELGIDDDAVAAAAGGGGGAPPAAAADAPAPAPKAMPHAAVGQASAAAVTGPGQ